MQQRPSPKGWHRTSPELLAYYESKLLNHMEAQFTVYQVQLNSETNPTLCGQFINTMEVISDDECLKPTIVIIHGTSPHTRTLIKSK
jgi:hypothetical protein